MFRRSAGNAQAQNALEGSHLRASQKDGNVNDLNAASWKNEDNNAAFARDSRARASQKGRASQMDRVSRASVGAVPLPPAFASGAREQEVETTAERDPRDSRSPSPAPVRPPRVSLAQWEADKDAYKDPGASAAAERAPALPPQPVKRGPSRISIAREIALDA